MSEVAQLNKQLEDNKEIIELKNGLMALSENKHFKEIIIDGFCKEHAASNVKLSGNLHLEEANRQNALAVAQAAGHLERFLSQIVVEGINAERTNAQIEDQLQEALSGGYDE